MQEVVEFLILFIMKLITHAYIVLFVFVYGAALAAPGKTKLAGKVTEKETGEPIAGVSVYFPDLKTGALTKKDGTYSIDNLPTSKALIRISMTGYSSITETIDLSAVTSKDFVLERSVTEISEVVVTGLSQSAELQKVPTPVTVVSHEQLLQTSSSNIIDAVAKEPGIAQLATGPGISKPVIRGLGYNRVVVVNDGIRQEGQQWGDEHGIEIDEYSVNKVEILKGPASLAYGSDAMAGVVNMISFPTLPESTISGNFLGNYQTNNGLRGYSANMAGNLEGFVFDGRFSHKRAHDYKNKFDGYVFGTKLHETNYSAIVGLNRSWGFSHLHLSSYELNTELPEGERDSATGKFIKLFALNDSTIAQTIASGKDFTGKEMGIPRQDILHYKAVLNNSFVLKNSRLNIIFGFQQNNRKEFADVLAPGEYELHFLQNTLHYDARFILPKKDSMEVTLGINGMKQNSENKGEAFLIPEYDLLDLGGFITAKKSWKKFDMNGGLRYDMRNLNSHELLLDSLGKPLTSPDTSAIEKFRAFSRSLSSLSGSIGFSYSLSKTAFTKLNVSRGFRAPNLAELGSNGVHEGTFRYEIGNKNLKAETCMQIDLALGMNSEHVTAEIDLFSNAVSNFIFTQKLNSAWGGDSIMTASDPAPVFKFTQGNAQLYGGEISIDIHPHPLDWLHIENSFSYVNAELKNATDSTRYLPFTPGPKFSSELKAELEKPGKFFRHAYFIIGADVFLKQDKIYSAYGTETETPGYFLLNLGTGSEIHSKGKTLFSFYIAVTNLTDVAYQSHLSRLKYAPENYATSRKGIFNMGRNISFKLVVPFGIKQPKE